MERISNTEFTANLKVKIGPVKVKFLGAVTLSDLNPPKGYIMVGEGKGGLAGFAKGAAKVILDEQGSDTVLRYMADAHIGGKIAQVGSRLIVGSAKKLADKFFSDLVEIIASGNQLVDNNENSDGQSV